MRHHIDFEATGLRRNYIGTLKHGIFEKVLQLFERRRTTGRPRSVSGSFVKQLARAHVAENARLLRGRGAPEPRADFESRWARVRKDFEHFSVQCRDFAASFLGTGKAVRFRTHVGALAQIKILGVKATEKSVKSGALGLQGKVDALLDCLYFPDLERFPEAARRCDVIADLKTGRYTKKNNHQIMYYMMAHFEGRLDEQLGVVVYSKSPDGQPGFTFDFVFPYKHYFLQLLLHRNRNRAETERPFAR